MNYNSDKAMELAREKLTCENCRMTVALTPDICQDERFICASCGKLATVDNGLCAECEQDLFKLELAFDVRDYAAEGDV